MSSFGGKLCSILNDNRPPSFTSRQWPITLWITEIWHYLAHQSRPLDATPHVFIESFEHWHDTNKRIPPAMLLCQRQGVPQIALFSEEGTDQVPISLLVFTIIVFRFVAHHFYEGPCGEILTPIYRAGSVR